MCVAGKREAGRGVEDHTRHGNFKCPFEVRKSAASNLLPCLASVNGDSKPRQDHLDRTVVVVQNPGKRQGRLHGWRHIEAKLNETIGTDREDSSKGFREDDPEIVSLRKGNSDLALSVGDQQSQA